LGAEVFELYLAGRAAEALDLAERYEWIARAFGDEMTVSSLMRVRMYVHTDVSQFPETVAVGEALLHRYQAGRYVVEEAKTLADLGASYVQVGRLVEGLHHMAQSARLLDSCRRGARYLSAMSSLIVAASTAELYEFAATAWDRLAVARAANGLPATSDNNSALGHAEMLLWWALRLDHLGHVQDARFRAGKAIEIARRWIADPTVNPGHLAPARCVLAIGLVVLGEADEACRVAQANLRPAREQELPWLTRLAHLAYGLSLRAAGALADAERELVAAQQLTHHGAGPDEKLIIGYELAMLGADPTGPGRYVRNALIDQTRQLWDLRLQRLAMFRQAQQRVELESRRAAVEWQLMRDPLTSLANRRHFDQMLDALSESDPDEPTVFLLIDIDKFKAVNDTYSHTTGDAVLRRVAELIVMHCRQGVDIPVRYAGDEFVVFLRALDLDSGVEVAERICAAVRAVDFDDVSPGLTVTLSIGVVTWHPGMTGEDLFQAADERLYEAKRRGRDQVAA